MKENLPLVSVIIPSYNRINTIRQTIDSIINQKCVFGIEIIIGDDCSTENIREVLCEYKANYPNIIRLLFHEINMGLGANWATCVKASLGKYICNCDNDDYWHNTNKLQIQVDYLENHQNENVVITNHRNHNRKTGIIKEEEAWIDRSTTLQQAIFNGKNRFCNATIIYRAEFLKSHINLEDYIRHQFTLQDWNTWVILSAYTDFVVLPVSTATFGVETESITRPGSYESIEKRFEKEKECYRYVCKLFPDKLHYDERSYDVYFNSVLLSLAIKKRDFIYAKKFAENMSELGDNSIRTRFSKNIFLFYIFSFLKKMKQQLSPSLL